MSQILPGFVVVGILLMGGSFVSQYIYDRIFGKRVRSRHLDPSYHGYGLHMRDFVKSDSILDQTEKKFWYPELEREADIMYLEIFRKVQKEKTAGNK